MHTLERLASSFGTDRYLVRGVDEADLADLLDVHRDDEVTRYLPYDTWHTMADAQAWLMRVRGLEENGRSRQFVVVDRADRRVMGAVVLFNADAVSARAELGYVLGKRDWGRGVMREVLTATIDRAFADLALRRLEAFADADNLASARLLQRLGFVHEGTLREREWSKGSARSVAVYGLLRA